MEIYDLCGNDGLASGIYRLEFIGAARRRKFYRRSVVAAQQWRRCACALYAGLAAWGRERRGRICGVCYGGSCDQRRSIGGGSDEAAVAGLLIYNRR